MSEVPQMIRLKKEEKDLNKDELKPYIQIFKGSKPIFNELSK